MSSNAKSDMPKVAGNGSLPIEKRLCRAEFHLRHSQTAGYNSYSNFGGKSLEEFVAFIGDEVGLEIWSGRLPTDRDFPGPNHSSLVEGVEMPPDAASRFIRLALPFTHTLGGARFGHL